MFREFVNLAYFFGGRAKAKTRHALRTKGTMQTPALKLGKLMEESELVVADIARHGNVVQQQVAERVLGDPTAWRKWESGHYSLMRSIADVGNRNAQVTSLRQATFALVHRKALFEYLRDRKIRGEVRRQTLAHFHRVRSYSDAVIAEHETYIGSACSHLCSRHIGNELARDLAFGQPMLRYEQLYKDYFCSYCDAHFAADAVVAEQSRALLPYLKQQVYEQRRAIIELPQRRRWLMRELEIRQATGDTQRIKSLRLHDSA
jgi:hypothetical protein